MIEKAESGDTLFFSHCNPTTGKLEWKAENKDEYDYFTGIFCYNILFFILSFQFNKNIFLLVVLLNIQIHNGFKYYQGLHSIGLAYASLIYFKHSKITTFDCCLKGIYSLFNLIST